MAIEEYLAKKLEEHSNLRSPEMEYLNQLSENYGDAPSRMNEDPSFDWGKATIMAPKIKSLLVEYYQSIPATDRSFDDPAKVNDDLPILQFAVTNVEKLHQHIRDESERVRNKELNYLFNDAKVSAMTGLQLQTILLDTLEKAFSKYGLGK